MKHIKVTAAVLNYKGKYLCVQRDRSKYDYISYKYEFPGGKIETNESIEDCLSRELNEELSISMSISSDDYFMTVEHSYYDFSITMYVFLLRISHLNIELNEHINAKWLDKTELTTLDWAAADLPIVDKLMGV